MPIVSSTYQPGRFWLKFGHVNTIVPALFRNVSNVEYEREVLEIDDGDFLDLDWVKTEHAGKRPLLIALHGLEGDTTRPYIKGVCRHFFEQGWDALALNQRTCGGRMNRLPRAYHMGVTDDLHRVVEYASKQGYEKIGLVGFSMGGNHVMKYLGEYGEGVSEAIIGGVAFSVPCHIASSSVKIDQWYNQLYVKRFLKGLMAKIEAKHLQWPDRFDVSLPKPKTFHEFDDRYTGPLHGFSGAADYYEKCSSRQFIPSIKRPCLLVNAQDDSFLSEQCFPREEASSMDQFYLEMPKHGGHVGFGGSSQDSYWSERRAFEFLNGCLAD